MNKTGPIDQLPMGVVWIGLVSLTYQLVKRCGQTAGRQGAKAVAVPYFQSANSHSAYRVCFFQYRVEHWGEVTWRGIDDLQHLGGRGLLLQRLARLGQQPRVLHRYDRLRGEILQQRDLLFGKRPNLGPARDNPTEKRIILPQRHAQESANTREFCSFLVHWLVDSCLIGDMNKTGPIDQLPMGVVWIGLVSLTYQLVKRCGQTAGRQGAKAVAVPYFQSANSHSAYRVCFFQYRVEHWGEVTWRGIDNLQYLGGRGLLLQRLARLGQQPRVLHRYDRLRGEILQQRDLFVGKRLDLLAIDRQHAEQGIILPQRYAQESANAREIDDSAAVRVAAAVWFLIH